MYDFISFPVFCLHIDIKVNIKHLYCFIFPIFLPECRQLDNFLRKYIYSFFSLTFNFIAIQKCIPIP